MTNQTKTTTLDAMQREATEKLAYSLWQQAGCPANNDLSFWLEAERLILAQNPVQTVRSPIRKKTKNVTARKSELPAA